MSDDAPIPFHRPAIGEAEIAAVVEVLRSGWLTTGPKSAELERAFAGYVGARHAVAVNSGTAALHLSLLAAGLRAGEAILTSPFTFPATTEVAIYCGADPLFADVDPVTLNLDPAAAEEVLERESRRRRVRAIVPVHYGGTPCAMERFLPLGARFGAAVVEDAAHALPAARRIGEEWRTVGTMGDFTAFSFYATKPVTTAEGGMITCAGDESAELLRSLRLHGLSGDAWKRYRADGAWRYDVARTGYKYNLPDVLAAIGLVQLARIDELAAERRRLVERYRVHLADLVDDVELPVADEASRSSWHLFPIRVRRAADRDSVIAGLRARGIGASVHFIPVHLHSFYAERYGHRRGDFPVAEAAYDSIVSLPLFPGLTEGDLERVAKALGDVLVARRGGRR